MSRSSSKTATVVTTKKVKAEKKVFSLPGQKYGTPEEREPLRIFYESLFKQKPESEMAEFWLMEHGMLSPERAKKHMRRSRRGRSSKEWELQSKQKHPMLNQKALKGLTAKNNRRTKKRSFHYEDGDDDHDDNLIIKPRIQKHK